MATKSNGLTDRIEQLLTERQRLAGALATVDATLAQINSLLGVKGPSFAAASSPAGKRKRGRRSRFAISAEESIIQLLKEKRGASTQEIKAHWKAEGRGGTADNTLSKMVREKKLKRTPLKDQRGSEYSVA